MGLTVTGGGVITKVTNFVGSITAGTTTLTTDNTLGTPAVGMVLSGGNIDAGTTISSGSGTSWTVNTTQSATTTSQVLSGTPSTASKVELTTNATNSAYLSQNNPLFQGYTGHGSYNAISLGGNYNRIVIGNLGSVTYNRGNCYNTSTGYFTCPVEGKYWISCQCQAMWSTGTYHYLQMYINDQWVTYYGHWENASSAYNSHIGCVLHLKANDTISFGYYTPGPDPYTVFQTYRLL